MIEETNDQPSTDSAAICVMCGRRYINANYCPNCGPGSPMVDEDGVVVGTGEEKGWSD